MQTAKTIAFENKSDRRTDLLNCTLTTKELSIISRAGWLKPYALVLMALKSEAEGNDESFIHKHSFCQKWKINRRYLPRYLKTLQDKRLIHILNSNRVYYTVKILEGGN